AKPVPTELVEAARDGSPAQIERLVEAIWPDAYRLARAILGERQGAEDAAQEACIILYRTISSLRSSDAFRAWFYRIVVREASELKRRGYRIGQAPEAAPDCTDQTAAIDVWRALSALPQHLREVVVLRYFEDFSSREIASILQIPDGTVRFRLMIARRRLRPLLGDTPEITHAAGRVRTDAI
ncbi:MAG: RNA polymerase sigma factor, partial [Candidatus Baltobacteraceae bacterium]